MFMSLKYLLFRIKFLNILSYVIVYNGSANFFRDGLESRYFRLCRPTGCSKIKDIQYQRPSSAQIMTS